MSKIKEHTEHIRRNMHSEIITVESGHKVWWSNEDGYLTSNDLRIMADYLDELNKDWDEQIEKELSAN